MDNYAPLHSRSMGGPAYAASVAFVYRRGVGAWLKGLFLTLLVCGGIAAGVAYVYMGNGLRQELLQQSSKSLGEHAERLLFFPAFDPRDKITARIEVALTPVARGLVRPTDIVFLEAPNEAMIVVEQVGRVTRVDLETGARARWLDVDVQHAGNEQGLLAIAIHPKFAENGRFFLNYTAIENGKDFSFVSEYRTPNAADAFAETPVFVKHMMKVEQPYANHNGGCTRFGPDGMLYVGWGDGGAGGDPQGHGQNGKTWLGSILRIDVDAEEPPLLYRVPADNPLRDREDVAPETFVTGVRNPWRFTWDPLGRMVVADVGQNDWEEVGYALPGENLGWNTMEGQVCFGSPDCETKGLRVPFFVYGRSEGMSVTGGLVSISDKPAALRGLYVFGDYQSGRLWALPLPADPSAMAKAPGFLGAWPLHPSTFGRDPSGRLYVADHTRGIVFRFDEKPK